MNTIASQITSLTVVYSIVNSGADQSKHQSSASLAFVRGIHRDRWIPRTKGQYRGKCFHLMTSSWLEYHWPFLSLWTTCLDSELSNFGYENVPLPECFCLWTFPLNIGLNISHSLLEYFTREFGALQLICHWKSKLRWHCVCKFNKMENNLFIVLDYVLHISYKGTARHCIVF